MGFPKSNHFLQRIKKIGRFINVNVIIFLIRLIITYLYTLQTLKQFLISLQKYFMR